MDVLQLTLMVKRRIRPQMVVRDFNQCFSLDYLYVDTSKVEVLEGLHAFSYENAVLL